MFAEGALLEKTEQLIAAAYVTQCRTASTGRTKLTRRAGTSDQEITEAIWVAAEMRAGGAFGHSTVGLQLSTKRR